MRVVRRDVFYCDFCKARRFRESSMRKHEERCTLNPARICRWMTDNSYHHFDLLGLIEKIRVSNPATAENLQWLRTEVEGCPACMLAVLRQSGIDYHYTKDGVRLFDYAEEVERFRRDEHDAADLAEMRSIESGWL